MTCKGVISGTFIACGEGENYCSERCFVSSQRKKAFCDYCNCQQCKTGEAPSSLHLHHAPTNDGRWICDVCYLYDVCTTGQMRNPSGPCVNKDCVHRPVLTGDWRRE